MKPPASANMSWMGNSSPPVKSALRVSMAMVRTPASSMASPTSASR